MQSKMKRTTAGIAAATTTDCRSAVGRTPVDSRLSAHPPNDRPASRPASRRVEQRLQTLLDALRGCAEMLLASDVAGIQEALAKLAAVLEVDVYAAYAAAADRSLTIETLSGIAEIALPTTTVAGIVAELERSKRRTLVLDSLGSNTDSRAAAFRDLGFASAIVGALVVDGRVLGAVVFATRAKEGFSSAEQAFVDTVVCYLAAAYERRELAQQRRNAEQQKHDFLTVLAHELRNPLAPVRNALEIIRANDRARSPVEHSAYAMIERQLQQIGRLADDLLDANEVVLGHVELAKQRVLLDAVVERAAEQSRPWIDSARHTLVVDLPREAIALDADAKRLARAFSNLVNNASRRMDRGGRIVISAEAGEGTVSVFVRARGRVVSGELMSGVFAEAEARGGIAGGIADGQSKGGVTAGMTLVKHLVELHGGTVGARTDADGVAEFEVRLPAIRAAVAARRKSAQPSSDESAGPVVSHRILIADDNADSAESMGMLLRLMGNDVRIASDGLEAVEQAAAFQPDIVLMDIGMPRLDGYEAARRIRNQAWSRDTVLVAVTGWGPSDDSEEATAAGFDHHFTKPLDPAELRRLVSGSPPH
jgi:CheY-like chemotaxis protein